MCIVLFFFKQKTAYEMRISDWSSDVCSSDLAGRDAAAIILDADRSVAVQRDEHQVAMPRQRLVDRIVRNLEHHVMQARPVVGVADIHARDRKSTRLTSSH